MARPKTGVLPNSRTKRAAPWAALQRRKRNGGQATDLRCLDERVGAQPAKPRPAKPSAIMVQVDGSGTMGIGPLTVVLSEIVDRTVGGAPSPTVTTYSSVIDQGAA